MPPGQNEQDKSEIVSQDTSEEQGHLRMTKFWKAVLLTRLVVALLLDAALHLLQTAVTAP